MAHLPALKSKTTAERVVWMTRTSDVLGSHHQTDLDSYLTLIRRKIQEKCATTQELIYQIRRTKIGDGGHVTPNEFRFTLIKFGVILPQALVDRIFAVFDSDRSGTMDFDEFAMWIMNSEFRPKYNDGSEVKVVPPEEILRQKLLNHLNHHPNAFAMVKPQISFLEFLSGFQHFHLEDTSDKDIRSLFLTFDPKHCGFVQAHRLKHWVKTGEFLPLESKAANATQSDSAYAVPLAEALIKICGRNTKHLGQCFAHIPCDRGVKISFNEFKTCLLSLGLGKVAHDVENLFKALGGWEGVACIDTLRKAIEQQHPTEIKTIEKSKIVDPLIRTGRADRALRQAIRKSYKEVKADIEAVDKSGSGFIDADVLHKILSKRCISLSYQDYRSILSELHTDAGGSTVNWLGFLHAYDPKVVKHALDGIRSIRSAIHLHDEAHGTNHGNSHLNAHSHTSSTPSLIKSIDLSTITGSKSPPRERENNEQANPKSPHPATSDSQPDNSELRRMWQKVLRECHRADPDRSGLVSRNSFIASLEKANTNSAMTAESMNKLADEYSLSGGLVDYMSCFRQYLSGMVKSLSTTTMTLVSADSTSKSGKTKTKTEQRHESLNHPWDYDYKRDKHPVHPYWSSASKIPRDVIAEQKTPVPSALDKSATYLTEVEKKALLDKYDEKVLTSCAKCCATFQPVWRDLRNDFKRGQINSAKGCILATNFVAILKHYGVSLTKSALSGLLTSFRGLGMQADVVRFDEFLRVCILCGGEK